MKMYVSGTYQKCLGKAFFVSTTTYFCGEIRKISMVFFLFFFEDNIMHYQRLWIYDSEYSEAFDSVTVITLSIGTNRSVQTV